jgi:hypothetical protein
MMSQKCLFDFVGKKQLMVASFECQPLPIEMM